MSGSEREGYAVITAKPLKRKGLGRPAPSTPATITEPTEHQSSINTGSIQDQYRTNRKPLLETKTRRLRNGEAGLIVKKIVELSDGIKASDVANLFEQFCKRKGFLSFSMDHGGVATILKYYVDKGELTRLKIGKVFHYYKKVA